MRVKINQGHRVYFEGRDRVEGDIVNMSDKEARINIELGRVVNAESERPLRVADPRPAAVPKRTYKRRDMTAED